MKFPLRPEFAYAFAVMPFFCGIACLTISGLKPNPAKAPESRDLGRGYDAIGGTGADHDLALANPDEYAWRLFVALNQQAMPMTPDAGVPDPNRPFPHNDPNMPVVWESWALVSGGRPGQPGQPVKNPDSQNFSELFLNDGATPQAWGTWIRPLTTTRTFRKYFEFRLLQDVTENYPKVNSGTNQRPSPTQSYIPGKHLPRTIAFIPPTSPKDFEVRLNRTGYEDIASSGLYSAEAVRDSYLQGTSSQMITFRPAAKAVKAAWKVLDPTKDNLNNYYCRVQDGKVYGLVALHVMTKDLDNWFWCSFVHQSGATPGGPQPDRPTPSWFKGLAGNSPWSHYLLRGTQTDFVDNLGHPTTLGNPYIEGIVSGGDYLNASCMTCHSRATIGGISAIASATTHSDRGILSLQIKPKQIGRFQPSWLVRQGGPNFKQTPFVWSVPLRVTSKHYPPELH